MRALILGLAILLTSCSSVYQKNKNAVVQVIEDEGVGTGVHIGDGYILTAAHVVDDDQELNIDGNETAVVVKIDHVTDLALLKSDNTTRKSVKLSLREFGVGDPLTTISWHYGYLFLYAEGIHAGDRGWSVIPTTYTAFIQSNPGSSGGPVFNSLGHLAGIIHAKHESITWYTGVKGLRKFLEDTPCSTNQKSLLAVDVIK